MDDLMKFFLARKSAYLTAPQLFDEVLYTPYSYDSKSPTEQPRPKPVTSEGDLLGVPELAPADNLDITSPELYTPELDTHTSPEIYTSPNGKHSSIKPWTEEPTQPEVFLFAYGTVVLWGMTEAQERRFLTSLKRFEVEKLGTFNYELENVGQLIA
jgi:uncharacterized Rmd1/YagE family protein